MNYNYSILKELEDFLTPQNIENLKNEFIEQYCENGHILSPISETGVFEIFQQNPMTSEEGTRTVSFGDTLLYKLLKEKFQKIKTDIDAVFIDMASRNMRKIGFVNYLRITIRSIRKRRAELLEKYPICDKPLFSIEAYLLNKYEIKITTSKVKYPYSSMFEVKSDIKPSVFEGLYDLAIYEDLIDDEIIYEKGFISALTEDKTDEVIKFRCENSIAVYFLELTSKLFNNLTPATIEKSKRFLTKQNIPFTSANYYTSKNRYKNDDNNIKTKYQEKFNRLKNEFEQLK